MESGGGVEAMGMRSYYVIVDGGGGGAFFIFFISSFFFPFCCMSSVYNGVLCVICFFSSASHLPFPSLTVSHILIELYTETGDLEGVYALGWVG